MNNEEYKGKGLQPLPVDPRDYSFEKNFGSVSPVKLTEHDFLVSVPLEIKDQDINYQSDFCAGYVAAEAAENEDQVIFVPEWTFAFAKDILVKKRGYAAIYEFGLNLRDICLAGVEGGFLPRMYDVMKCDTPDRPPRNYLATLANWPDDLKVKAAKYRKEAFFMVDGSGDFFDNVRSTLFMNLGERRTVITGCVWRLSWNTALGGIIPEQYEKTGSGHAILFIGQKTIAGEIHLVAQLSDGTRFGDNGFFYFPRKVVNKEFGPYGGFTFKDLPAAAAEIKTTGVPVYSAGTKLYKGIIRFISKLLGI